jgi:protein TonB
MSAVPHLSPAEFSRDHQPLRIAPSSRAIAGALTAALYALFALLVWRAFLTVPEREATQEITAILLPDMAVRKVVPPPPPFLAHLIKPRAETVAPPTFTIASAAPVAPAQLPASAAKTSPIDGGLPAGTGASGAGVSANGSVGNGTALAGCLDPAWMRSVTDHVQKFFYYPGAARAQHATGVAMVHFIMRRDGRLDTLEIGKSSGDWALDDAAYNMVRKAQPMPAIPDHMHTDRIDLVLPIVFGIPGLHLTPSAGSC